MSLTTSNNRAASKIDETIGARIKARRLAIGVSQERLAEELHITFQQVQKYEKGVNRIAAGRLQEIADVLDTPVASFYAGLSKRKGSEPPPSPSAEHLVFASKLGLVLERLSEPSRELLLETARAFARYEITKKRK